mgnify:CR=1 FL=1
MTSSPGPMSCANKATCNAVVPDGGRGDPKSVYSDNGWDENYDLGDRVSLPVLDDDWRDEDSGEKPGARRDGKYTEN